MNLPFEYERVDRRRVRRHHPDDRPISNSARVVILPVPLDRTTSYVPGTRNGPHEILVASSHMELWDEETGNRRPQHRHLHAAGDGVPVRDDGRGDRRDPARRGRDRARATSFRSSSAASIRSRRRSSRPSRRSTPGLSVLQIDAHADLRESFMGTPHNHACAMRRVLEYARGDAGRHPQPVAGGGRRRADAADDDLLRLQHAAAIRTGSIASSTR